MVSNSTPSAIVPMVLNNVFGLAATRFADDCVNKKRAATGRAAVSILLGVSCKNLRWRIFRGGSLGRTIPLIRFRSNQSKIVMLTTSESNGSQPTKIRAEAHSSLRPTTPHQPSLYHPKRDAKMVSFRHPTADHSPQDRLMNGYGPEPRFIGGISAIIGPAHDVHFCTTNGFCRFIGGGDGREGWYGCMCRKEGRGACKCMAVGVQYSDRIWAGCAAHLGVQSIFRKTARVSASRDARSSS